MSGREDEMSQEGQEPSDALRSQVPSTSQPPPPVEHEGNKTTLLSPVPLASLKGLWPCQAATCTCRGSPVTAATLLAALTPIQNLWSGLGAAWGLAGHCGGVLPTGKQLWEGWPWGRHIAVSLNPDCPVPPQQTLALGWLFAARERGHESSRLRADTRSG